MRSLAPLSLPGLRWYQAFDASGIVPRLDRPSGNVTGFASNEASIGGKSLELLSEIAPGLKRAGAPRRCYADWCSPDQRRMRTPALWAAYRADSSRFAGLEF
jgi:hypothetical protein